MAAVVLRGEYVNIPVLLAASFHSEVLGWNLIFWGPPESGFKLSSYLLADFLRDVLT